MRVKEREIDKIISVYEETIGKCEEHEDMIEVEDTSHRFSIRRVRY